jgi:cyanophycinase
MKRALFLILVLTAASARGELKKFFSGSTRDARPALHGPVLILAGGGKDVEPALQAAIDAVRGCTDCPAVVDVAVLRASGADGYNPLFMSLHGVNSVVSFVITDRASADRRDVARSVRNAELVFFAGGDQCNYIRWIKGTRTARAVEDVYRRGGAIGGTSAGLAIQSEIVYDACPNQSAQSKEVLLDPFHADVSLSRDFFHWRFMASTITDTHLRQRDRIGRLMVFLARTLRDDPRVDVLGIGISERTTLLVGSDGVARVWGDGPVYLVRDQAAPEVCERGKPLTDRGFRVWRFDSGATLDLAHPPADGDKRIDIVDGKLSGDPY